MSDTVKFPNLDAFYDDNPERRRSGEADYGVMWRGAKSWPLYRVSYVQATGEVYAVAQGGSREVTILAVVPPDPDNRVETGDWGTGDTYYRTLDGLLDGWADRSVSRHSLTWIKSRLTKYAPRLNRQEEASTR